MEETAKDGEGPDWHQPGESDIDADVRAAIALRSTDPKKAVTLFDKAAQRGSVHAMFGLGGIISERSPVEASEWFRKAAQLGYAPAMLNLGIMYRDNRLPHEARQSSELPALLA